MWWVSTQNSKIEKLLNHMETKKISILGVLALFIILGRVNLVFGATGITPDISSSMITYLQMNNNSAIGENDTFLVDSTGRGSNGTIFSGNAFFRSAGILSSGEFKFDGNADIINLTSTDLGGQIKSNSDITISMWINASDTVAFRKLFNSMSQVATATGGMTLERGSDDLRFYTSNGTTRVAVTTEQYNDAVNSYTHIVVTLDNANKNVTFYQNGVLKESVVLSMSGNINLTSSQAMTLGGLGGTSDWNGSIDEFIVYNKTLSPTEVSFLYDHYIGECNSQPFDKCAITKNTVFDGGTYNLNGSTGGAVEVNANNIILDCNGSTLIGNFSQFYVGIYVNGNNNYTIQNCNVKDYYQQIRDIGSANATIKNNNLSNGNYGITTKFSGLNDADIYNNRIINYSVGGIALGYISNVLNNINLTGNWFNGSSIAISDQGTNLTNLIIYGNTIYNPTIHNPISMSGNGSSNWIIDSNYFYGSHTLSAYGSNLNSRNVIFKNNFIDGYGHSILVGQRAFNVTIQNNTIQNGDDGMKIMGDNVFILNNTVKNMTFDTDTYTTNAWLLHARNVIIDGNNYTKIPSYGLSLQNTTNVTIRNNRFDFLNWTERGSGSYYASDRRTPQCMIQANELVKGWLGDGMETSPYVPFQDNRTNKIGFYNTRNLTIYNNTYDADTQCFLASEGIDGLSHDFTNFWYISFQMPTYLKDRSEYWINNNFENLSWIGGATTDSSTTTPQDYLYSTYFGSGRQMVQYKVHKTWLWLEVLNSSTAGNPALGTVFNSSSALIHNGTSICRGSSSSINSNNGDININVSQGEKCYRLNNYNLTEGATARILDALWFASSTITRKTIANNLSTTLNNLTVVVFTNGTKPDTPKFTSHTGATTKTYSSGEYSYDATTGMLELNISGIEPSASSNIIYLDTGAPSVSLSLSSTSVYSTYPVTISCSSSDDNPSSTALTVTKPGNSQVSASCGQAFTDTSATGTYTVTYSATDTSGNSASMSQAFTVKPYGGGGSGGTTATQKKTNQTTKNVTVTIPVISNTTNTTTTPQEPDIWLKAEKKINEVGQKIKPEDITAKQKLSEAEAAYASGDYSRAYSLAVEAEGLIGNGAEAQGADETEKKPAVLYYVVAIIVLAVVGIYLYKRAQKRGLQVHEEAEEPVEPKEKSLPAKERLKSINPVPKPAKDADLDDIQKRLEDIRRKIDK